MRGMKTLTAAAVGVVLLIGAAPASAAPAAYKHFVACGLSQNADPSHSCPKSSKKGAFFRSNKAEVFYTVCVKFPSKNKPLCAQSQKAEKGTLYVNKITSNIPGEHEVIWFVEGKRVGSFTFTVKS